MLLLAKSPSGQISPCNERTAGQESVESGRRSGWPSCPGVFSVRDSPGPSTRLSCPEGGSPSGGRASTPTVPLSALPLPALWRSSATQSWQPHGLHTGPLGVRRGATGIAAHGHGEPLREALAVVTNNVRDCPRVIPLGA